MDASILASIPEGVFGGVMKLEGSNKGILSSGVSGRLFHDPCRKDMRLRIAVALVRILLVNFRRNETRLLIG